MDKLEDKSNEDLLQNMLEVYARAIQNPNSEKMHNRSFELRDEMMRRLTQSELLSTLSEIAKGQQPQDYGKPMVTIERMRELAAEAFVRGNQSI